MSAADIFGKAAGNYTRYRCEVQVANRLVGGIPKDPDTIKGWLTSRLEVDDAVLVEMTEATYRQMREESGAEPERDAVMEEVARQFEGGNGFKTVDGQLVYEGRCMKAAIKEAANIAYPNKTPYPGRPDALKASGLKSKLAERVFVDEEYISLGVDAPSDTEQRIKHIMTPQGPRSAINVVDVVDKPMLSFTVSVLDDFLKPEVWARIWSVIEANGLGSDRARGDGTCELITWEKLK